MQSGPHSEQSENDTSQLCSGFVGTFGSVLLGEMPHLKAALSNSN